MANSPVDLVAEIMSDLDYAMSAGSDLEYAREKDGRISVRVYSDDGILGGVVGYLKLEEKR